MPGPLLLTKLYVPHLRAEHLLRPRLTRLLNEGLTRKVALVGAPAGDSDPTRFLTCLLAALQRIDPATGQGIEPLPQGGMPSSVRSHPAPPHEALLTTLINNLVSVPFPFVLVLDDYHSLSAGHFEATLRGGLSCPSISHP